MQIIHQLEGATLSRPSHVAVGTFDGIHRGHQHLIGSMGETAHRMERVAAVVTFAPHPGALLGRSPVATLSTVEERTALLEDLGVDLTAVLNFTAAVAGLSATQFVAQLRRHVDMVELWAGPDFALGHRREGDIPFLRQLGEEKGFTVRVVEPLYWREKPISSTRIREALTVGDIEEANGCLGRPYHLGGTVVHGRGLGHTLGVPTANLDPPPGRLIPANGIYACMAHTEERGVWPAVINVGVRPTIAAEELTVEAHLLDFEGSLYEQKLGLDFIDRLRDEQAFPSLNALVVQMQKDIAQARQVLSSYVI